MGEDVRIAKAREEIVWMKFGWAVYYVLCAVSELNFDILVIIDV